jgi:hypothetical protein
MADALKALGNKAIAEKNFDEAVYVYFLTFSIVTDQQLDISLQFSLRPA